MTLSGAPSARVPAAAATGAVPPYEAVIFDMDGVVTDTAAVHAAAWKQMFDDVLSDPRAGTSIPPGPFDADTDYRLYVDGRAREDGVAAFLSARGLDVPMGRPEDQAQAWTVYGLARRKNAIYLDLLAEHGVRVFDGTVALLRRLRSWGVATGLVTASRNAGPLLAAADLQGLFDVVVDGGLARDLGLAGKPDPATFLEAARRLGVRPGQAAVVEDAVVGVQAARRGGFALVVGVDRNGHRDALEAAGADVVVQDVAQLDLGLLRADPWLLVYEGFDSAHEGHREALTTLGNGYVGTRGAAPESRADDVHYPGTYLAGVYNRLTGTVQGRPVEDEHLVNSPNWLLLDVRVEDGPWWSTGGLVVLHERRELDLRVGVLTRDVLLTDVAGHRLRVTQRRLVSMDRPHLAALETSLVAEGWDGSVSVRSGVDAAVTNNNVAEYRGLANQHLGVITAEQAGADTLVVVAETSQSQIRIAMAARTRVSGASLAVTSTVESEQDGSHARRFDLALQDGRPVLIDKTVAIATSRDPAMASPELGVLDELSRAPAGFAGLLPGHRAAWARLWARFGIRLDAAAGQSQLVLNLHVFHLLQAVSAHTAALDAGVPARGLHGEGYRGHVFWDELFVLPVVTMHLPAVTRSLLDYRWRRLDAARLSARTAGLAGAMFPWQSGSDGREETPTWLFNVRSSRWMPDHSRRQLHVGLAVAYDAWQYYQTSGDRTWLAERGAELIIEVARLFAELATYDAELDRFHIAGVMGPDEYHDGYPDAPGQGLRDNAYTNVLTAWVCGRAAEALTLLAGHEGDELVARLGVDPQEPVTWGHLSRRLAVPIHDGVISQFDGYQELVELDWHHYRATYGNIGRLDLILEAEGDTTNRYRLAKQADVLMLIYLLGPEELLAVLGNLGYPLTHGVLVDTVDYYLARTAHGSTLSRVVHASVLARLNPTRAWSVFRDALAADLDDTQGGTTKEGIHLGAMAGTIDLVTRAFAGLQIRADTLVFTPRLPVEVREVRFQVTFRGQRIDVRLDHDRLHLAVHPCAGGPEIVVAAAGARVVLRGGQEHEFRDLLHWRGEPGQVRVGERASTPVTRGATPREPF